MGIKPVDIVVYIAFILGFVFVSIFIISVLTEGWKEAFPSALKGLGGWIGLAIMFALIGLTISFLRGCIY